MFDFTEYDRDGVVVLRDLFTPEERAALKQEWDDFYAEAIASHREVGGNPVEVTEPIGQRFAHLIHHPRLLGIAKDRFGGDVAVQLFRLLVKDKHYRGSAWLHHDMPYYAGSGDKISLFIALGQANERNGGLYFVRETHKFGWLGYQHYYNNQIGTIDPAIVREGDFEHICPTLGVGDVIMSDMYTWHYSKDSEVDIDRPLVQIVYSNTACPMAGQLVAGKWRTNLERVWGPDGRAKLQRRAG